MVDKEITTAQAIEELSPLKRFGRALDKLDTVLQACQGAETRERSAKEAEAKLQAEIAILTPKRDGLKNKIWLLEGDFVQSKEAIVQSLKEYEEVESEELNERLNCIRANISKLEQAYAKKEADGFSRLKIQGEEIKARETRYAELGELIKKIQAPVQAIEVE